MQVSNRAVSMFLISSSDGSNIVVVVIAQQLFSYRQLSRLRKSATAAGLSHRSCTKLCWMALTVEQMLCLVWCHSTLRTDS